MIIKWEKFNENNTKTKSVEEVLSKGKVIATLHIGNWKEDHYEDFYIYLINDYDLYLISTETENKENIIFFSPLGNVRNMNSKVLGNYMRKIASPRYRSTDGWRNEEGGRANISDIIRAYTPEEIQKRRERQFDL